MSMRERFCPDPLAGFALRAEATFSLGGLACDNRSIYPFFNFFVQISERIRTVVGRGYFPHDSSHSEDEASARKMAGFQNFFLV